MCKIFTLAKEGVDNVRTLFRDKKDGVGAFTKQSWSFKQIENDLNLQNKPHT